MLGQQIALFKLCGGREFRPRIWGDVSRNAIYPGRNKSSGLLTVRDVSKRKIAPHFLPPGWNLLRYFVFSPFSTFLLERGVMGGRESLKNKIKRLK
jgi:hypothetical protein